MATSRRPKIQEKSTQQVWLRLCDPFIRTDGNLICPIIKAESSIRVLYTLQEKDLKSILHEVFRETGMKTQEMKLYKSPSDIDLQDNLFISCVSPDVINEEKLNRFRERLRFHLSNNTTVRNISVDRVHSSEDLIPQPMVSEPDFEMHKLELCYKALSEIQSDEASYIKDSMKNMLEEFKEKHTKIAILSQNGKGKSFLLNLLFLLTIDNQEEYQSNNKELKLPKDITGDPTIEELGETINQLPDVVKDFLKTYENTQEKFKAVLGPICYELKYAGPPAADQSKRLFSSLPHYFKYGARIEAEPYILPEKDLQNSYESTTKCIIHLRYGTCYQIKVDYFSSEDLKQQLYELVSLSKNDTANEDVEIGLNKKIRDKAYECLLNRFAILTNCNIADIKKVLQKYKKYSDIVLCREVEQFAGRSELYFGSGKNSSEDRLALKAILKGLTSPQNSDSKKSNWKYKLTAVKEIVVYIPSKFLYGGKEILEMPGTDDSDALALDFINKALNMVDGVFVLNEFSLKIAETEVKDILVNSDFMKKWKKYPGRYPLMFLAYPEKNANFQFKKGEREKIEIMENTEMEKRSTDLKEFCKLIEMRSLPRNMESAIFTSYILPVLHTSIHAQKEAPHEVIHEHNAFLKKTGINKLISHLDAFICSSRKTDFMRVQDTLTTKETNGLLAEHARALIQLHKIREAKAIRESTVFRQYDQYLYNLKNNLELVYSRKLDGQIAHTLAKMAQESLGMWDLHEGSITTLGVFNPYFSGNHPTYKVKISRIILRNIEDLKREIFAFLEMKITELLKVFKKNVTDLFTQELNSVLEIRGYKSIDSRIFVTQSIQDVISNAQQWYVGRQMKPITEYTVEKYLKQSKKVILKKHILIPAYTQTDLNYAKQLVRENIYNAVMDLMKEMKKHLLKLHRTRWDSFCSHLNSKNNIPKLWQVLLSELKKSCNSANTQPSPQDDLSKYRY
ncbi:uncharacterized protein RB166_021687 isoform 2-T2 [Leptodactylus fuscus]|uniref:uncharacterized protein LOC142187260 isoform X2 n=1 Tax=Leptodactylus fuscus TaxID=238119 RepID=UPI003F4E5863